MEWFPGRAFAFFRRAAKEGRSRRSEISLVLLSSRRSDCLLLGESGTTRLTEAPWRMRGIPAAAGNPPGLCGFALCLCNSFPCPVASGGPISLPPKKSAKETAKGNLSRRRFPLESFPIGQGAAAPLRSPGVYGGRWTRNERREFGRGYGLPQPVYSLAAQ